MLLAVACAAAQDLPIAGLAHAGFLTSDIDKARAFYTGVLGYEEPFDIKDPDGTLRIAWFKINDDQYIEVFPGLKPDQDVRMTHIAFRTPDVEKLRTILAERGLDPTPIREGRDKNRNFSIKDPDGTRMEFVLYMPGSPLSNARGKGLTDRRISTHLRHAGVLVSDQARAAAFWRGKLGFTETWRGGPGDEIRWINLRAPGGSGDYVEHMLYTAPPTRAQLGSMLHICLEVPDIEAAYAKARERGIPADDRFKPRTGRNGRRQLNLFDPDGSRAELMEPARR